MNFVKRVLSLMVMVAILLGTGGLDNTFAYVPARVNTLDDELIGDCTPLRCTLRAAINSANPGDTIYFEGSLSKGIIHLIKPLVINEDITIYGLSDGYINISGDGNMRLFSISEGVTAEFVNVNLIEGFALGEYGGAIYIDSATVRLDNVNVNHNLTGAIYMHSDDISDPESTLYINNVTFRNNNGGNGAAVSGTGTVDVLDSTFINNGAIASGGAINLSNGLLRISNSTFINNAADKGGAVAFSHGTLSVSNSTFYNNTATAYVGGAIRAEEVTYAMVSNCTFSGNDAVGTGGSLYVSGYSTLRVRNTIFLNNANHNYCYIAPAVDFIQQSNMVQTIPHDNQCGSATIVIDPMLGGLADNGGATLTMMPDYQSPVIDAGDNTTCEARDQIGTNRPVDGDGDSVAVCDIGAVEFNHQH